MMTWILLPNFKMTAKLLDMQRLGKQRVEAITIYNVIKKNNTKIAWSNHPIVLSWKYLFFTSSSCELLGLLALKYYINCMIKEFIKRGYNNNYRLKKIKCYQCLMGYDFECDNFSIPTKCHKCGNKFNLYLPWWCYWNPYIFSNIASLLRKNPFHYNQYVEYLDFDPVYSNYGYIWPIKVLTLLTDDYFKYADPIMKDNVNPVYCKAIIKTGIKKNERCNQLVRKNNHNQDYCGKHQIKYPEKSCIHILKNGNVCNKKFKSPYDFCKRHCK